MGAWYTEAMRWWARRRRVGGEVVEWRNREAIHLVGPHHPPRLLVREGDSLLRHAIYYTTVPEPHAAMATLIALATLLTLRRRA